MSKGICFQEHHGRGRKLFEIRVLIEFSLIINLYNICDSRLVFLTLQSEHLMRQSELVATLSLFLDPPEFLVMLIMCSLSFLLLSSIFIGITLFLLLFLVMLISFSIF